MRHQKRFCKRWVSEAQRAERTQRKLKGGRREGTARHRQGLKTVILPQKKKNPVSGSGSQSPVVDGYSAPAGTNLMLLRSRPDMVHWPYAVAYPTTLFEREPLMNTGWPRTVKSPYPSAPVL